MKRREQIEKIKRSKGGNRMYMFLAVFLSMGMIACDNDNGPFGMDINDPPKSGNGGGNGGGAVSNPILLVIDEDAIDNGNEPNNFSATDVNDQIANVGQRKQLKYFADNVGRKIDLYTGEVGDEGLHAIKTIPNSWKNAGPTSKGATNFVMAGPGLGSGKNGKDDDTEVLLDKIPNVTPLRATGLKMLEGSTVFAVVYESDISINYSPLNGNLQGANLGLVAFKVLGVTQRFDGSDSSLPKMSVMILSPDEFNPMNLSLFSNAPVPESSSEPEDIAPPAKVPAVVAIPAS